jgi:hypothetical protein
LFYGTPRRRDFYRLIYLRWYNLFVTNIFLIQLIEIVLVIAGTIALTASAHLFGTPVSPAEQRKASDQWNRRRDVYRLPINLETIAAAIFSWEELAY